MKCDGGELLCHLASGKGYDSSLCKLGTLCSNSSEAFIAGRPGDQVDTGSDHGGAAAARLCRRATRGAGPENWRQAETLHISTRCQRKPWAFARVLRQQT